MAQDLTLPEGTRLVHIGPHKTGTTAVQGAFHLARERLAEHGVLYAGNGKRHPWAAAHVVTGRPQMVGEREPRPEDWTRLVEEIATTDARRIMLSSEFFADSDDAAAQRVVDELGGPRVHIAVTLRPLAKILASQWQQYVQNRTRHTYDAWLDVIFTKPPGSKPNPTFWGRHNHGRLVERWVKALGDPERLTVIVVDERDRQMLLRTFESLLALPSGFLVPEETATNRSLTRAEVEVVRLINEEFRRRKWPAHLYSRYLRNGAVAQLKTGRQPQPDEPRIATPDWALDRAAELGAEFARTIEKLGVRIIGDIASLGDRPASKGRPAGRAGDSVTEVGHRDTATGDPAALTAGATEAAPGTRADAGTPEHRDAVLLPPAAAAQAVVGAIAASGDPDPTELRLEDRRVHDVTARELLAVLAKRLLRRVRGRRPRRGR